MNLIEFLGSNWLIIIILGLTGLKILSLLNQKYMDKKIDESNLTQKEMNITFAIIGTVMTAIFVLVGYYFWNTYHDMTQLPLFIGLVTMSLFIMFYGKYSSWLQKRDDKRWKNEYGGKVHGTLPKGYNEDSKS